MKFLKVMIMRFINEDVVDAHLFEIHHVVRA